MKKERIRGKIALLKKEAPKELHSEDVLGNAKKKGDVMKLSDSDFDIKTKGIELVIVNDAGDAFIPVIDINIDESNIIMKKNIIMMNILTPFALSVFYYNPQVSRWEPIIEKGEVLIEMTTNAFQNPHLELKVNSRNYITADTEENKEGDNNLINEDFLPFNINVSTQMLSVLMKTKNLMSNETKVARIGYVKEKLEDQQNEEETAQIKEIDKEEESKEEENKENIKEKNEEIEYVSPYSIKNETGYQIEIVREAIKLLSPNISQETLKKNQGKVHVLNNGETMNLQIESDRDQLFTVDNEDYDARISVTLKGTYLPYNPIHGLDLSRVKTSRFPLKEKNVDEKQIKKEQDAIYLISNVGLDSTSNRRLITISSQLVLKNRSLKHLFIKILREKNKDIELVLPRNSWIPIPLDLVKNHMVLRYEDTANWSEKYSLERLLTNNSNLSYEVKIDKTYLMFTVEKEGTGFGKTVVMIDPPYLIKNCLPITLEMQISSECLSEKYYKLKPQEEIHQYDVPISTKFFVKLKIAGFGWSLQNKLYSPNTEFCKEIKLPDVDGNVGTINVFHLESFIGAKKFFFYLKGYIINETTYKLTFYGIEKDKNDKKLRKVLSGQGKSVKEEQRNTELIMFSDQIKGLEINEKESEESSSKEVPLGTIGDAAIEFQTKSGYVHLGVSIKHLCVGKDFNLFDLFVYL